ncbi:MAG: hypothetical protein HXY50_10550 [Ignavibacteriaceae bacterium]|nr:hypothetical protein [Ignavibacteriaceae bacterium]
MCPSGWHIPTNYEFQLLGQAVEQNSNAFKKVGVGSATGVGTNTSGFSGTLRGSQYSLTHWHNRGALSYFWSSTEGYGGYADCAKNMIYKVEDNYLGIGALHTKINGKSIRCIKD